MSKGDVIELMGQVDEVLPNAMFRIKLETNQSTILGHLSGRMRQNKIQVLMGDRVKVEVSPYDLTKCRVVFREK